MSKYLRGQDVTLTIRQGGTPLTPIAAGSGTLDFGLEVEAIELVGQDVADQDGFNGATVLSLDMNPRSAAFFDIIDAQTAKNRNESAFVDWILEAEVKVQIDTSTTVKYGLPDCVLTTDTLNLPAGEGRLTQGWTLTSKRRKRIA